MKDITPVLETARRHIGHSIVSKQYGRIYHSILQLHQIRDIELIYQTANRIRINNDPINKAAIDKKHMDDLRQILSVRLASTDPSFRTREAVLAIRRTAFDLLNIPEMDSEIGQAWIKSSSIARKAGYEQTAYTATLQAIGRDTPFAFIQQAKLRRAHDGAFKTLTSLRMLLAPMIRKAGLHSDTEQYASDRQLAKVTVYKPESN